MAPGPLSHFENVQLCFSATFSFSLPMAITNTTSFHLLSSERELLLSVLDIAEGFLNSTIRFLSILIFFSFKIILNQDVL